MFEKKGNASESRRYSDAELSAVYVKSMCVCVCALSFKIKYFFFFFLFKSISTGSKKEEISGFDDWQAGER